jgi:hypothetical protein
LTKAVTLIADATIPNAKIVFGSASIPGSALVSGDVGATQLAAGAVTAAKLGNESTVDLVTSLPASGAFTGQFALDTDDAKAYIWDGSQWVSFQAAGSVNTVIGSSAGLIDITVTTSGDTVTITTSLDNTTGAAEFLGGPTGSAGAVGYRPLVGTDLPTATTSAKGGVIVNGEGLRMDGDTIEVDNDLTASATHHLVTYSSKGLIAAGRAIVSADLPAGTTAAKGAVIVGTGLSVDGTGLVNHTNSVVAGTAPKVTFDAQGHITAALTLAEADIPDLPATKLTTGTLDAARIGTSAVTGAKLANYSVCKIGDTTPTADYTSQFFFNPLSRDLFLWDGNVYQPIGISVGEIVFAGTFDASLGSGTGLVASVTAEGTALGLIIGQALPAASTGNSSYYLVVSEAGTITTGNAPHVALTPPDIVLSNGTSWTEIDVSQTITAQVASNVSFTASGSISATNVQTAIQELDTEKLAIAGGTMTGNLEFGTTGSLSFEGATANGFETTLAVVDPTAARTITLPDSTGTVVLSGAIVNADINASAAIAFSKLANVSATDRLLGRSTAGAGAIEEVTCTAAGRALIDDADADAQRTTLGVVIGTDVQAYDADTAKTDVTQSFTAQQRGAITALTDGATITADFALANNFSVTLGGNRTLANPTNQTAGASGCIWITQDGTGSRTLAYGSNWDFSGGTAPTLSTAAAAVDCLVYSVQSSTKITATLVTNLS